MTYEEFKQNFLPEFLKIKSFAGKMKFANQYLTRIGSGSGRIVYDIDGKKVLKLAKNPKGVAQNEMESNIGRYLILHLANNDISPEKNQEYPMTVVYRREDEPDGEVYAKKPHEFILNRTHVQKTWHVNQQQQLHTTRVTLSVCPSQTTCVTSRACI